MSRRQQTFVAPDGENKKFIIPESDWFIEGKSYFPGEHWDILIDFVHEKLPEYGDLFEQASYLNGDFSDWSTYKTSQFRLALEKLCTILSESEDLTSEETEGISEWFENSSYIEMVKIVIMIVDESLKSEKPFDSYAG
jgi:hypothetical protein